MNKTPDVQAQRASQKKKADPAPANGDFDFNFNAPPADNPKKKNDDQGFDFQFE